MSAEDVDVTYSKRGFPQFGDAVITDYGHKVRIYASSSAEKDACWMNVDWSKAVNTGGEVAQDTSVHMTVEQVTAIRDRLDAWLLTVADIE